MNTKRHTSNLIAFSVQTQNHYPQESSISTHTHTRALKNAIEMQCKYCHQGINYSRVHANFHFLTMCRFPNSSFCLFKSLTIANDSFILNCAYLHFSFHLAVIVALFSVSQIATVFAPSECHRFE